MNRTRAAWAVGIAFLVLLAAAAWLLSGRRSQPAADSAEATPETATAIPSAPPAGGAMAAEEAWTARLYFPASNDLLVSQEAPVVSAPGARARATGVVAALLAATPVAPRVAVFPPEVKLGKLLLLEDGTVIVDLRSEPAAEPPPSGSTVEQLRIYAVVHTILRNVEEAKRVVLLWNGVQRPTLSGHVDTGKPLRLRAELEAS